MKYTYIQMFTEENSDNINATEKNENYSFPIVHKWDELDIDPRILRGIYSYGFEKPSPIQSKAIYPIISGKDIIAQSQSGTGKTATYSIGALSRIDFTSNSSQILILSPTHELTKQIATVIKGISTMIPELQIMTLIGGSSIDEDAEKIKENMPHIIVGCPGRVYDMIRRNHINGQNFKLLIMDEADEMLSSGFKDQVYNIFKYLHNDVQVALFSATLPPHIKAVTSKFMRNPVEISVTPERLTLEGIKQYYVALDDDRNKFDTLKDLYGVISLSQCIIYCNSVNRVIDLYEALKQDCFPVCCIHSNMDKSERDASFKEFRQGNSRVLISSNVTARGIDIQQVSTVINFDIPKDIHTYIHRIGRSGRWGRKGVSINFITRRDVQKMKEIEKYYNCQIDELPTNFSSL